MKTWRITLPNSIKVTEYNLKDYVLNKYDEEIIVKSLGDIQFLNLMTFTNTKENTNTYEITYQEIIDTELAEDIYNMEERIRVGL
jgi:hypothetical protein